MRKKKITYEVFADSYSDTLTAIYYTKEEALERIKKLQEMKNYPIIKLFRINRKKIEIKL